jgi:hypothetical protein
MMILDFHVVQALLPTGNIAIVMATTRSAMGDRLCKHFVNMVKTIHVHALASEKKWRSKAGYSAVHIPTMNII